MSLPAFTAGSESSHLLRLGAAGGFSGRGCRRNAVPSRKRTGGHQMAFVIQAL